MYTVQRDSRNFSPCPDTFWPERWLLASADHRSELTSASAEWKPSMPYLTDTTIEGEFKHNSSAFIPFSIGPANCAGKNLALLEMRMVICSLIQNFDVAFAEGWDCNEWEQVLQDIMVAKVGRLPVQLSKRQGFR